MQDNRCLERDDIWTICRKINNCTRNQNRFWKTQLVTNKKWESFVQNRIIQMKKPTFFGEINPFDRLFCRVQQSLRLVCVRERTPQLSHTCHHSRRTNGDRAKQPEKELRNWNENNNKMMRNWKKNNNKMMSLRRTAGGPRRLIILLLFFFQFLIILLLFSFQFLNSFSGCFARDPLMSAAAACGGNFTYPARISIFLEFLNFLKQENQILEISN